MSVNGESLAFDENVDADHSVDPDDVDWRSIFDTHAASDGLLDMSTRADAVQTEVDGIQNSRQAEALLSEAADAGFIEERGTDYYLGDDSDETTVDDVDWRVLFADVAEGVTNPLPSAGKRKFLIKSRLGLESEQQADELIADACDRGLIVRTTVGETSGLYLADALEDSQTDASESNVTANPESINSDGDRGDEPEPATDRSPSADSRPDPSEMARSELEREVEQLRTDMDVMESRVESMFNEMNNIKQAIFGSEDIPGDPEKSEDLLTKFVNVRDRVDEHDDKLTMVSSESGSRSTPDERAQALRMALYEDAKANRERKAVMNRDQAKYALNGGLSRAQLLDAMRRAADGKEADIDGSSDLEPLEGVQFVKGTGRSEQSKIRMNLTQMPGEDLRKNLTTKQAGKGGE